MVCTIKTNARVILAVLTVTFSFLCNNALAAYYLAEFPSQTEFAQVDGLIASELYVGYRGSATATQSFLTNNYSTLYLGYHSGSFGAYRLMNGAVLNTSLTQVGVGGAGYFNNYYGTHNSAALSIANHGNYTATRGGRWKYLEP